MIVAELCNQHGGDMARMERMILHAKFGGAHAVKVQLYDTDALYGPTGEDRRYLELSFEQTVHLQRRARDAGLEFFASFFDEERLGWCLELDFPILKIASRTVAENRPLCEKAIATGRRVLVSLGHWDWERQGLPFEPRPTVEYLYCVSEYPTRLDQVRMPVRFQAGLAASTCGATFAGYSDHAIGPSACLLAIARGAAVLEKHFTVSRSLQCETERGHIGAMDWHELALIRRFWDDAKVLGRIDEG